MKKFGKPIGRLKAGVGARNLKKIGEDNLWMLQLVDGHIPADLKHFTHYLAAKASGAARGGGLCVA
ncbi:hypothetical protein KAI31_04835, partial [Candidatus Bathyarchaeota archaeon]|nr:hypothetical protein [Candidatus Bathyarchaeota archaeon]